MDLFLIQQSNQVCCAPYVVHQSEGATRPNLTSLTEAQLYLRGTIRTVQ